MHMQPVLLSSVRKAATNKMASRSGGGKKTAKAATTEVSEHGMAVHSLLTAGTNVKDALSVHCFEGNPQRCMQNLMLFSKVNAAAVESMVRTALIGAAAGNARVAVFPPGADSEFHRGHDSGHKFSTSRADNVKSVVVCL